MNRLPKPRIPQTTATVLRSDLVRILDRFRKATGSQHLSLLDAQTYGRLAQARDGATPLQPGPEGLLAWISEVLGVQESDLIFGAAYGKARNATIAKRILFNFYEQAKLRNLAVQQVSPTALAQEIKQICKFAAEQP